MALRQEEETTEEASLASGHSFRAAAIMTNQAKASRTIMTHQRIIRREGRTRGGAGRATGDSRISHRSSPEVVITMMETTILVAMTMRMGLLASGL